MEYFTGAYIQGIVYDRYFANDCCAASYTNAKRLYRPCYSGSGKVIPETFNFSIIEYNLVYMEGKISTNNTNNRILTRLVWQQVKPYKKWLLLIFIAMLITTLMDIATPWPLKIIIDNVIDNQPLPSWLAWIKVFSLGNNKMALAASAAITLVVITVVGPLSVCEQLFHRKRSTICC